MIEPAYLALIKRFLHFVCITVMLTLTMDLHAIGQKANPVVYVKHLRASKQIQAGGAAGVESRALYLITCKMVLPGEISNVKATIADEHLPVRIVYKNAEHDKVYIIKGDSFFFRITKRLSVSRTTKAGPLPPTGQPSSSPSQNKKNQPATIRFTINRQKKELLQIKSFSEEAPPGYQLQQ